MEADQERAFHVFTARMGAWWPAAYHIGPDYETAIVEPFTGGRWYERSTNGAECEWGRVLIWDSPRRLVLAWQISAEWTFDPNLETEIEVIFTATGPTQTRVEFEHRNFEQFGDRAAEMHAIFSSGGVPGAPQGWTGILRGFAALAAATG